MKEQVCRYIKWLLEEKLNFVAACPTNKAAKNLRNLAASEGLELEVKTIAQLLNLSELSGQNN